MNIYEILILSGGVAMDATAVALACSVSNSKTRKRLIAKMALFFGIFQAAMPLIGFLLGYGLKNIIQGIDHWVAFFLLAIVGGKMVLEQEENENQSIYTNKKITLLAIATSIDALIIGVTLSFIEVNLLLSVTIIGFVTFLLSLSAGLLGKRLAKLNPKVLTIAGGIAIILIGLKILTDHLF